MSVEYSGSPELGSRGTYLEFVLGTNHTWYAFCRSQAQRQANRMLASVRTRRYRSQYADGSLDLV